MGQPVPAHHKCKHSLRLQQQRPSRCLINASRPVITRVAKLEPHDAVAPSTASAVDAVVHDGRLPFLQTLLQFAKPNAYAQKVLAGHRYAWGKMGLAYEDALFVADPAAARSLLTAEWQNGIRTEWPPTFKALLGEQSISILQDPQLHSKLRQVMGPTFSAEAVAGLMPGVQQTVAKHVGRWAQQDSFAAYPAARLLTFDVLVNQALGLGMDDDELAHFAKVFKQWGDGFMPPGIDLPFTAFGKGMAARREMTARVQQSLRDPNLGEGVVQRLRDEFGADSQVASDNVIVLMFAGYDTTSSAITYMLNQLALNPHVLEQMRQEQAAVQAQHGNQLTPAAVAAMPYTTAVVKETLRTAQVIGYVPRVATQALKVPGGGPELQSGCPFIVALGAMAASDPAAAAAAVSAAGQGSPDSQAGTVQDFRPERWLQPELAKSLALHQAPFGMGAHYCLGSQLAMAELTAVLAELARSYSLTADTDTDWPDFPIKRPANGLPCTLRRLATA